MFRKKEVEERLPFQALDSYVMSDYFKKTWFHFLKEKYESNLKQSDSTEIEKMGFTRYSLQYVNSKNIKGKLKELIVSQLLNEILGMYAYRSLEQNTTYDSLIASLTQTITDSDFIEDFNGRYADQRRTFLNRQIGKKAPDFSLVDSTGKIYTLNNFKGKILLVDVWASWCRPCVEEFPYLQQLERTLKGNKDFQLLSVSTDESRQIWLKNGVLKFKPPGLGLWGGKEKIFNRDYNIDAIPVLLLIDGNGNFINFNPPRASDGDKLYKLILEKLEG